VTTLYCSGVLSTPFLGCRQEGLFVDKREDTAWALRDILSDNCLEQAQNNTVVTLSDKNGRVGFEPTTLAMPSLDILRIQN